VTKILIFGFGRVFYTTQNVRQTYSVGNLE